MRRGSEMGRGERNVPGEGHRDVATWPVILSAVLLSGAVAAAVSAATVRSRIASEAPADRERKARRDQPPAGP